jgi:tRNA pseudouridine55 synthase
VRVDRLDLVEWDDGDPARPVAVLEIVCSAGTYVRSIARDLGAAVGSGAYLGALVRTASGPFRLEDAVALEEVRVTAASGGVALASLLRPIDAGLDDLPEVTVAADEVAAIARGQFVRLPAGLADGDDRPIRVRADDGRLIAIAVRRGDRLMPDKVLVDPVAGDGSSAAAAAGGGESAFAAASAASEADPSPDVDPDPASPDDV